MTSEPPTPPESAPPDPETDPARARLRKWIDEAPAGPLDPAAVLRVIEDARQDAANARHAQLHATPTPAAADSLGTLRTRLGETIRARTQGDAEQEQADAARAVLTAWYEAKAAPAEAQFQAGERQYGQQITALVNENFYRFRPLLPPASGEKLLGRISQVVRGTHQLMACAGPLARIRSQIAALTVRELLQTNERPSAAEVIRADTNSYVQASGQIEANVAELKGLLTQLNEMLKLTSTSPPKYTVITRDPPEQRWPTQAIR